MLTTCTKSYAMNMESPGREILKHLPTKACWGEPEDFEPDNKLILCMHINLLKACDRVARDGRPLIKKEHAIIS